jgi:hypothetical protein
MLCGFVLGGSAQAADLEAFKGSSGNIVCELDNGEVDCFINSGLKRAPWENDVCHIGDPTSSNCLPRIAAPFCAGDNGPLTIETDAKGLAEGSTLVKGEIDCVAFKSGLVCVNSKGRGFLSAARWHDISERRSAQAHPSLGRAGEVIE